MGADRDSGAVLELVQRPVLNPQLAADVHDNTTVPSPALLHCRTPGVLPQDQIALPLGCLRMRSAGASRRTPGVFCPHHPAFSYRLALCRGRRCARIASALPDHLLCSTGKVVMDLGLTVAAISRTRILLIFRGAASEVHFGRLRNSAQPVALQENNFAPKRRGAPVGVTFKCMPC